MSFTKTVNFKFIEANHNMIALMYGIEEYNRIKKIHAVIHRNRYWQDFAGQPRRNPTMRPLLHNGDKPR